jgi:hypothetical protein
VRLGVREDTVNLLSVFVLDLPSRPARVQPSGEAGTVMTERTSPATTGPLSPGADEESSE